MLFHNYRISICGLSHGSRRRTEWMTVTASCDVRAVETAEAQKSGKKKSPKKCLMSQWLCYSKLGAWVDTSRSESSQLHGRLDNAAEFFSVLTGSEMWRSLCDRKGLLVLWLFVSSCEQHKISNMSGYVLYATLPTAYVPGTRIKPWNGFDLVGQVRPIMSRGRGFDTLNENPLSEIFLFGLSYWDVSQCRGPFLNLSSALFQTWTDYVTIRKKRAWSCGDTSICGIYNVRNWSK